MKIMMILCFFSFASVFAADQYKPTLTDFRWALSENNLPLETQLDMPSHNNVAIARHDGRLFMAYRTAPDHFASASARMYFVSSKDEGVTWNWEWTIDLNTDIREPNFLELNGHFYLYYVENGSDSNAFEVHGTRRLERHGFLSWAGPENVGEPGELFWEIKKRFGKAYATSYVGNHYELTSPGDIAVHFQTSDDGLNWHTDTVYRGGVSEVAFEFDDTNKLWAVTRNEDGDDSGFGSHIATAEPNNLSQWHFPKKSNPYRYDSPRMFKHEGEIYLIARRDIDGPFDSGNTILPFGLKKLLYLGTYWERPKRTALYKIDREHQRIEHIFDLPSAGDTAFPSIVQTGTHEFFVANYTSPLEHKDWSWREGQTSDEGTQIYFVKIKFEKISK